MSSILEGKIIDLGLVPQDFFTTEKLPIKKRLLGKLKTWFASLLGSAVIPIVIVWNFKAAIASMSFKENGSSYHVERCTSEDQAKLGIN
jgi:hypothetical protein